MSEAERREFAEHREEQGDEDSLVIEKRRRVLIVDDDPDFLVMAEAALDAISRRAG